MSSVRRIVLGLSLSVLVVAGCGVVSTTPPAPTPADFPDLAGKLALQGIKIDHVVSGDAGCTDPNLVPTAISFEAHGLDQAETVKLYLYVFRNADVFEKKRQTVDTCAEAYVTDPETFESIDQSPYVLTGQGPWGTEFEATIRGGLATAAGDGGTSGYGGGDSP